MEVPVTVVPSSQNLAPALQERLESVPLVRRLLNRCWPAVHWLRPDRHNLPHMLRIVQQAVAAGRVHLEFVVHSSELMPGGSPLFPTHEHIERLYEGLEILFELSGRTCTPATLSEFYEMYRARAYPSVGGGGR